MKEYRIFECIVCGWLYDESKGSPEDGIAAGTRWEDVPEDWHCPECGVSKQEFEMVEQVGETATIAIQGSPTTQAPSDSKPAPADLAADSNSNAQNKPQFKLWECLVCGWIYDEAKGWPEDGIAPGTRWQDIPEDWICPECGVEKSDFEMLELSPNTLPDTSAAVAIPLSASLTTASATPIVVIGTGLAGYNFVRELRKRDTSTPVLMLTQDDGRFYSKPLISTGYHRHKTADELASASAEKMARELDAEIRIFTQVDSVDTAAQIVATTNGTIHYSKLVLATGARCIEAPLAGSGLDHVYTINDLLDYAKFRTAMVNKSKVLIIGAGLIGSEYANDLVQCGYALEVVDPLDSVLATLLPKAASDSVKNALQDQGVRFHFGTVVNRIDKHGRSVRATLANGDTVDADIVLSAIGVRANIKLAKSMGLECNRGIVTDRTLATSAENVYALGDCAEVDGHLLYFVAPLMECTRKLAATVCGEPAEVYYGAMPVTVKTTIYPVNVSPPQQGALGEWRIDIEQKSGVLATFRNAANELLGFATTGDCIAESGELAEQLVPLMPKP